MDELYLDRFQLLRQLGKGGMGEVWLAHDPRLGRKVAIKTLPLGKATPSARQRFQREIRSLAACNHQVIARIYEAGEAAWPTEPEKTVSFIVMELVSGETLKQRISRGPVPPAKALSIVCQALDGLAAAHDNQLVHRDIKPSNLMITSAGEVKLLDLGLARFVQTDASSKETARPVSMGDFDPETTLTRDGDLIGTPAYMSPEQALSKRIDARADIWAVGLLLFEMLTGERAIKARSSAEALIKMPEFKLEPKLLPKGTSLRLVHILKRCLSQDLRLRYHHARDLLYDLRLVQEDQEGTNRAWRFSPLGWVLSLCLGIALAALVAVFPRSVTQPIQGAIDLGFDGYSPVLSPDGTRIFYVGEDGREIRMAAASATGNHQQVLSPGQIVKNLAVSPDSSWIFFDQLYEDGTSQVFRVPAAGGASRRVTTGWAPAVSRNGELVSFFEWANTTHKGLWICRADGGDRRLVTVLDGPLEPLSSCFTADAKERGFFNFHRERRFDMTMTGTRKRPR